MKTRRLELDKKLRDILESNNVYFQPPENLRMQYPAIRYERNRIRNENADNIKYLHWTEYAITLIDRNPDSQFIDKIRNLKYCIHERHYVSNNLHHDVFIIYV